MKKKVVLLLLIWTTMISSACLYDTYCHPVELVVENEKLTAGACDMIGVTEFSLQDSNTTVVKEGENIDRLEMVGEVDVKSEPVVFPDSYYDPESETYREEEFWDDMELVALVCVAESEGESELGKRLVIDTIFNRAESEYYPNTIYGVIYDNSQYACVWDGRLDKVEYDEYIANLVIEEMNNRTNSDVIYFKTGGYFEFGTPLLKEGNHYFSGR